MANTKFSTSSVNQGLVKSRSMLVGNAAYDPSALFLIQRQTATGSETSITFNSIPSTYSHLQVRMMVRLTATGTTPNDFKLNINGTTSTYRDHHINGNGSTVTANNDTTTYLPLYNFPRAGMTANSFGVGVIDIDDYTSSTKNKTLRMISGWKETSANGQLWLYSGLWVNTNPITSLTFAPQSGAFAASTTFALYGIK